MTANAASRLIQHYVDNYRQLPWRSAPGAAPPSPYVVWLSEIMLQQTTVAAVVPRFRRFIARWPTVEALAAAEDKDVLSEWAGLGYYARARNLIACARKVAARGSFPASATELRELPGIGDYSSAAIAALAFGEHAPAVDTNVERVIARLMGLAQPSRADVKRQVAGMMQAHRPADVLQALMDLGSAICRPKRPLCSACPLNDECAAHASGEPEHYPARRGRPARVQKYGIAYWIEQDGQVWLVRRASSGLLGGMAALPGTDWTEQPHGGSGIGTVRHVFTHLSLDLAIERRAQPVGEGWWQPLDRLDEAGLPTLYRRAAELARSAPERLRPAA